MEKINCILLIDDDEAINFLHNDIIEEMDIANHVHTALNGKEGLDYLMGKGKFRAQDGRSYPRPNIIFLDINMPLMDGYEFLEEYKSLPKSLIADTIILFVSTSNSQRDKNKAEGENFIHQFLTKPLTIQSLQQIHHFYLEQIQLACSNSIS